MKAVIALGSNLEDRKKNILLTYEAIEKLPNTRILKKSNIYETEPWGFSEQGMFLNSCVLVETELSPKALLGACLGIEAAFGRVRTIKNGPRILDLDLICYENSAVTCGRPMNAPTGWYRQ